MTAKVTIKQLTEIDEQKSATALIMDWLIILAILGIVALWGNIVTFLTAFLVIARQQHALVVLNHDAAHRMLFKNIKINDLVGQWLTKRQRLNIS